MLGACAKQYKNLGTLTKQILTKHQTQLPKSPKQTQRCPYCQEQHMNYQDLAAHIGIIDKPNLSMCKKNRHK